MIYSELHSFIALATSPKLLHPLFGFQDIRTNDWSAILFAYRWSGGTICTTKTRANCWHNTGQRTMEPLSEPRRCFVTLTQYLHLLVARAILLLLLLPSTKNGSSSLPFSFAAFGPDRVVSNTVRLVDRITASQLGPAGICQYDHSLHAARSTLAPRLLSFQLSVDGDDDSAAARRRHDGNDGRQRRRRWWWWRWRLYDAGVSMVRGSTRCDAAGQLVRGLAMS